jgi:hypothetical protein
MYPGFLTIMFTAALVQATRATFRWQRLPELTRGGAPTAN